MKKIIICIMLILVSRAYADPSLTLSLDNGDVRIKNYRCMNAVKGVIQPYGNNTQGTLRLRISLYNSPWKHVLYNVMYTNNGYKTLDLPQYVSFTTKKNVIEIPYYPINDDLAFAANQVYVTANINGQVFSASFPFNVYRTLFIEKSNDKSKDCMTMFKSEKITGVISNTSSQLRYIEVVDRINHSQYVSKSRNIGWSLRFSAFNIANLGADLAYLRSTVKGIDIASEMRVGTQIAPGENIILNRQMTLFRDAYNIKTVDACGEIQDAGTASYTHWAVSYPVSKVDMTSSNPLGKLDVGYNDQMNTCDEDSINNQDGSVFIPDEPNPKTIKMITEAKHYEF